ncbi:MAG: DUF6494 family protein [Pseudomonadota bacterium]
MSDDYQMSTRKFLKQVGVTAHQAIEDAVKGADGKSYAIKAVITIEELDLRHEVDGTLTSGE